MTLVQIDQVIVDYKYQARAEDCTNPEIVDRYVEVLESGGSFDDKIIVHVIDGSMYLVAGFHRLAAAQKYGDEQIDASIVENSSEAEAFLASAASNLRHGRPATPKDRAKAAMRLIELFPKATDTWVSANSGIHRRTAAKLRVTAELAAHKPKKKKASTAPAASPAKPDEVDTPKDEPVRETVQDLTDEEGRTVPGKLYEIFMSRDKADELARELKSALARIDKMAEAGLLPHIDVSRIKGELKSVVGNLKFSVPYAVCPYCGGIGCQCCRAAGWLTQAGYNSVPDQVKVQRGHNDN